VAKFKEKEIARLMKDEGIIRARAKIEATIRGAQIYCEMADADEDFADYCWSFTNGKSDSRRWKSFPTQSEKSVEISKALKKRGFKFCGPTIVYAWMQAVGIVQDHSKNCFKR